MPSDELLNFIIEGIPYRYDDAAGEPRMMTEAEARAAGEHVSGTGPGGMAYEVRGPAAKYGGQRKLSQKDEQDILLNKGQEGLWWHYEGKYYRVTKALKIPYVVYQDGDKKPVIKHIFVGYAGIDVGG